MLLVFIRRFACLLCSLLASHAVWLSYPSRAAERCELLPFYAAFIGPVDTTNSMVLHADQLHETQRNWKLATIAPNELVAALQLLQDSIEARNASTRQAVADGRLAFENATLFPKLSGYKKVLSATISAAGEKQVRIFCYRCDNHNLTDWRKYPTTDARGGGDCYLRALINLTNRTCDRLSINAPL